MSAANEVLCVGGCSCTETGARGKQAIVVYKDTSSGILATQSGAAVQELFASPTCGNFAAASHGTAYSLTVTEAQLDRYMISFILLLTRAPSLNIVSISLFTTDRSMLHIANCTSSTRAQHANDVAPAAIQLQQCFSKILRLLSFSLVSCYSLDEYRPLQLVLQPVAVCAEATECYTAKTAVLEPLPGVQLLLTVDYATTANGGHTVTAAATASGVEPTIAQQHAVQRVNAV
eukprot:9599-Heterococcus_DN1.PRE.2